MRGGVTVSNQEDQISFESDELLGVFVKKVSFELSHIEPSTMKSRP